MSYYRRDTEQWSDRPPTDADGLSVEVVPPGSTGAANEGAGPAVQFFDGATPGFRLSDAVPFSDAVTTHTIAVVDPEAATGRLVAGLRVTGDTVSVDDLRDTEASESDALNTLREALDEILIPVYIDDAVSDLSEGVDGVVAIQTVQRDRTPDDGAGTCTYSRAAVFEDGDLLLEDETGEISV